LFAVQSALQAQFLAQLAPSPLYRSLLVSAVVELHLIGLEFAEE
jgi:hypothetical protein